MIDVGDCEHDPKLLKHLVLKPYECPKCGHMVVPGVEHPDHTLIHDPPHSDRDKPISDEQHFATSFFENEDEDDEL